MFEVSCPSCSASFEYNIEDYIHLCPYCSSGFILDLEEGAKDLISDHYVVANQIEKDEVEKIFFEWLKDKYHSPNKLTSEIKVLGVYGISLPYWVISMEAHTLWSGHSKKAHDYPGQRPEQASKFLREEGHFSRRYRWSLLARKSPKEHWGMERLHKPVEKIAVDWDGFPFDETMGVKEGNESIYKSKQLFKFEYTNGIPVAGIQVREMSAIARAKDQVQEYHRRVAKTMVGTLYEHRTEIEIVGLHLVHVPFWYVRYAYIPKSVFKYFTPVRERRIVIQGASQRVVEAELPLTSSDKVMTNLVVTGVVAFVALVMAVFFNPIFFILTLLFTAVAVLSAIRLMKRIESDRDLIPVPENNEPYF